MQENGKEMGTTVVRWEDGFLETSTAIYHPPYAPYVPPTTAGQSDVDGSTKAVIETWD